MHSELPPYEVVTDGNYYSVAQMAAMGLPGMPRTKKGWYDLVARERWAYREVEGRGGKAGILREYLPPLHVGAMIKSFERGDLNDLPALRARLATRLLEDEVRKRGGLPAAVPEAARPAAPCAEAPTTPAYQATAAPAAPWINIEALTQAILAMQQLRPNEPLAAQVKKGVEFYCYCVERGMVTRDGNGPGDLKGAA